ncbi:Oidioi.mRNA.OKI2018_I69.XSR.g16580.t1.cds [Oikopleura dioica]|uniref:Oidioi.mRNA.OKI2018_I69.XSR.g16580.t1.cds n=1 Tax=Oikopleura dioica TaxID=34765 RepID=A0ABN7SKH3_OIKDI|nr:Oidioi.mRNA.OKI2018_I69.XSR.g16580.t1.cds [Oikopleura dioica]
MSYAQSKFEVAEKNFTEARKKKEHLAKTLEGLKDAYAAAEKELEEARRARYCLKALKDEKEKEEPFFCLKCITNAPRYCSGCGKPLADDKILKLF